MGEVFLRWEAEIPRRAKCSKQASKQLFCDLFFSLELSYIISQSAVERPGVFRAVPVSVGSAQSIIGVVQVDINVVWWRRLPFVAEA